MEWDVTVGIPVYNGEDRLDITLNSLVTHHGGVKEIIISDNASTDKTAEIAKRYAQKYKNIFYIRQPEKIPIGDNIRATLEPARGKYYIFIGHHDLISENYFSELIPLLEQDPEAVIGVPYVCRFKEKIEDMSDSDLGTYFNPLRSNVSSDDIRERVYSVLKDSATCCFVNQLYRTEIIKQIFSSAVSKYYVNYDHVMAMHAVLLGHCKVSDKAFYYYHIAHLFEKPEETRKRYSENIKGEVSDINPKCYIPRFYWRLCQKYAAHIADEMLKMDIRYACKLFDAEFETQDWIESHVAMSPPQVSVQGLSRAYCAISTALREEESCRFYRNHFRGQFSEFRPIAEQRAENFYLRMWEILINEGYLAPKFKLNIEETAMFNKLMRYKNERLQAEKNTP